MKIQFGAKGIKNAVYRGMMETSVQFVEEAQLLRTDLWKRFAQQFKEDADFEGGWRG